MNQHSSPLISVIVATFNSARTLQQCIDSVSSQTYTNRELIVIDGGSTDGTVELLTRNRDKLSYWISEPDHGIYSAWNKGLARAKGDWICFVGADDFFWDAKVLERVAANLAMLRAEIRVAYGQVMLLTSRGENLYSIGKPWEKVRERFRQVMSIPHPGLMHRKSFFEKHGSFDESFRIAGDYELLLRELKTGEAFFIPDIITLGMRQGGISSTPENSLIALRENRRAQRMHGQRFPGCAWLTAMARLYMRLMLWRVLGESFARKVLDTQRRMMGLPLYWTRN